MDFVRKCYYSKMRLYRDRPDVLTPGRWHFCPPGAVAIPYPHLFGSFRFDSYRELIDPPVGEVPLWGGFSHGSSNPRIIGQNWCGSEQLWTQGSLYSQRGTPAVDLEGIPLCCRVGGAAIGGAAIGGSAIFPDMISVGGGVGDGATVTLHAHHLVSQGGGVGDGATVTLHAHHLVSQGGGVGDGDTAFSKTLTLPSSGGGVGDGDTAFSVGRIMVSAGGGVGDGATVFSRAHAYQLVSTGGGVGDGSTATRRGRKLVSTGGGVGDGTTPHHKDYQLVSTGGGVGDGSAY